MFYGDIYQVKHNVLAARSYCTRQCVSSLRAKSDFKLGNVHVLHDMYGQQGSVSLCHSVHVAN